MNSKRVGGAVRAVLVAVSVAAGSAVAGEKVPAAGLTVPMAYTNAQGATIPYRFAAPKAVEPGKRYPLVLLFHGAGERGTNNVAQLVHGATDLLNYMREKGIEGYFIAGQCPSGQQWVDTPWSLLAHKMPEKPSAAMSLMIELIEKSFRELPIDRDRVLVTGISMGGYGTWDIVQRHPDWFAAAMPCCGGGDRTLAWKIREVPIWAFHGDQDTTVPFSRSRDMVAALWAVDGKVRYREYPGVGHNCWAPTYADWDQVLAWFFAQRRQR